jgi:hypothetical protein
MDLKKPKSLLCTEKFMIANTEILHLADELTHGQHKISLKMDTADA